MSPCAGRNTIAALLAGAIDESSVRHVEEHLDACANCRQLVADLGRGLSSLSGDRVRSPARLPRVGARVDRYTLRRLLGIGGMGVVFEAHDPTLGRKVALKLVRPDVFDEPSPPQLLDEARAMARVQHPNVVTVYDAGVFADQLYVCMEYVAGTTLRAWLSARRRSTREILDAFVAAGAGLAHIHRAGLVHLDFKPDNVLVATTGRLLVSDFGLTRMVRGQRNAHGMIAGTPAYMAPEQTRGEPTDARADQYSFSAALREAFGERAPRWLVRVIGRGMSSAPGDRYPSMDALLAALAAGQRERRSHRTVAAMAVLGVSGLAAMRPPQPAVQFVDRPIVLSVTHAAAAPALPAPQAPVPATAPAGTAPRASSVASLAPPALPAVAGTPPFDRSAMIDALLPRAAPSDTDEPFAERCDDGTALACELDLPHCAAGAIAAIRAGCWTCADELTCHPPPGSPMSDQSPGELARFAAAGASMHMSGAGTTAVIGLLGPGSGRGTVRPPGGGPGVGSASPPGGGPSVGSASPPGGGPGVGSASPPGDGPSVGSVEPPGGGSACSCGDPDGSDCGCTPGSIDCRCGPSGGGASGGVRPPREPGSAGGADGTDTGGTGGSGTGAGNPGGGDIGTGNPGSRGSGSGCNCGGAAPTTGAPGGGAGNPAREPAAIPVPAPDGARTLR